MFDEDSLAAEKSVIYGASTANTVCSHMMLFIIVDLCCFNTFFVSELKVGGLSCKGTKHTGELIVSE
jgi:hypothetical protein